MKKWLPLVVSLSAALLACDTTPRASSLSIGGAPERVQSGSSLTLSATVNGANNPDQSVTWSAEGGGSFVSATANPASFTAPVVSSDTLVTVRASSVLNPEVSSSASFTVFATPNPDPDPDPNPDPNPTPEIIVDIAAGEEFTFAVTQSGRVLAWGSDADDQLGDGDGNTNRREAVHVIGADRVTAVGAGSNFGLALRDDGTVLSWGFNANDGRLGTGSSANEIPTAERVFDLENIVAIAAGGGHALALNSSGTVFGWGASKFGAVGDGSQTPRSSPVKLDLPGKAVSVAAGESHSLALLEDGRVYAWGRNHLGQLGLDSTSNEFSPLEVTNTDQDFEKIVAIAAGDNHSVALRKDGIVFAWGDNAAGQLGVFETGGVSLPTFVSAPQAILEVSGVVALEAGGAHTLALRDDGTLLAWGSDAQGQLGDDTTLASSVKPVKVSIDQRVKRFAAGFDHSLALLEDGSVLAWGGNRADQLGDIAGLNEANSPVALRVSLP